MFRIRSRTPCGVVTNVVIPKPPPSRHRLMQKALLFRRLALLDTVNIILSRLLVFLRQVVACILAEPLSHLVQFLAKTAHGLRIHVGVRNQIRHGDWELVSKVVLTY